MCLQVVVSDDASDIGLTKEAVVAALEYRLRTAWLYGSGPGLVYQSLFVTVHVAGPALGVEVAFIKLVRGPSSDAAGWADTWVKSSIGTHGDDASYLVGSVSRKVDRFLVEFLRKNESSCEVR